MKIDFTIVSRIELGLQGLQNFEFRFKKSSALLRHNFENLKGVEGKRDPGAPPPAPWQRCWMQPDTFQISDEH